MGLTHVRASTLGDEMACGPSFGRTRVMVASRVPLSDVDEPLAVPRPESAVSVLAQTASGPLEVHCVHVPNAANGWVKVQTLYALRRGLEAPSRTPRLLCGDLNTPRRERRAGTTASFPLAPKGRLRPARGPAWDAAELGVVPGLGP